MSALTMPVRRWPSAGMWVLGVFAVGVAGYALRYVIIGERAYVPELAPSFREVRWLVGAHALFGPIALLAGFANMLPALRVPPAWPAHRWVGRAYVVGALATGAAGLWLSTRAAGGTVSRAGFALLALGTIGTTALAWSHVRQGRVRAHREWMLRSYSLILGAVTLRLWLPLLIIAHGGEFLPAYRWVSWLSWVPNIVVAEVMIGRGWRPRFHLPSHHSQEVR